MKTCKECGSKFEARRGTARFCSKSCRMAWNNRRRDRGAELYDAFMAMRYDREAAKKAGIDWTFICRMGEMWNAADQTNKIRSYQSASITRETLGPSVNARVGRL